jgi:predicted alpha/beta-fold hydrolase
MVSLSQACLEAGFAVHRFHMRSCGGTAHLCPTLYHGGLTSDLRVFLEQLRAQGRAPAFLAGFSLGGNVVLKLAGELGENNLIAGVSAASTPIDLAACARRLGEADNRLYERRFVRRMCDRLIATGRYKPADFAGIRSIFQIDDRITAPSFGFHGAEHYYATQSSNQFLARIRVPALIVQAQDDTFIPFEIFRHPAFESNPFLTLLAPKQGGHLGFIARHKPRLWLDGVIVEWIEKKAISDQRSAFSQTADS